MNLDTYCAIAIQYFYVIFTCSGISGRPAARRGATSNTQHTTHSTTRASVMDNTTSTAAPVTLGQFALMLESRKCELTFTDMGCGWSLNL